jgi:hypothetical protein
MELRGNFRAQNYFCKSAMNGNLLSEIYITLGIVGDGSEFGPPYADK